MAAKFKLVQTCVACPEKYDVYHNGSLVGYLRLRHGRFRAEYLGNQVYEANPQGDGRFYPEERSSYLMRACQAISAAMEPYDELFEIEYQDTEEYDD